MSYEGYSQFLCEKGHYWIKGCNEMMYADDIQKCPKCKHPAIWENMVNTTNGSYDGNTGERIDGFVELKFRSERTGVCGACGEKHICEKTYFQPSSEFPEPSLQASNHSPQTNQSVEQGRGDISTLDASTIAHDVGKVKTADTSRSKDDVCVDCGRTKRNHFGRSYNLCNEFRKKSEDVLRENQEVCENCGLPELNEFGTCMHCGFHNEMKFSKKSKSETNHSPQENKVKMGDSVFKSRPEDTSKESKIADELNKDYERRPTTSRRINRK